MWVQGGNKSGGPGSSLIRCVVISLSSLSAVNLRLVKLYEEAVSIQAHLDLSDLISTSRCQSFHYTVASLRLFHVSPSLATSLEQIEEMKAQLVHFVIQRGSWLACLTSEKSYVAEKNKVKRCKV